MPQQLFVCKDAAEPNPPPDVICFRFLRRLLIKIYCSTEAFSTEAAAQEALKYSDSRRLHRLTARFLLFLGSEVRKLKSLIRN